MPRSSTHRIKSASKSSRLKSYRRRKRLLMIEPLESRRLLAGAGAPFVSQITRLDSSPNNLAQIRYQVLFDEAVTGVDVADFAITKTGAITGYSIASVTGSGTTYVANVNTGTSSGTLRLDVIDNDTIRDYRNSAWRLWSKQRKLHNWPSLHDRQNCSDGHAQ